MNKLDLYKQVAQLHIANINQGFLATLGVEFVSLMYRAVDEAQSSMLLTEERDERVVGFVSGGCGMGAIYRQMLHYPLHLATALLPSLLHPKRAIRILEIIRYSRRQGVPNCLPDAELLSIAVDPSYRGRHVAEKLYHRLEDQFRARGIQSFKIVVGESLAPAHRFYVRMGAIPKTKVELHRGENSIVYVHSMP